MKNFYCFCMDPHMSLESAWELLEKVGIEVAYGSEENQLIEIYGYLEKDKDIPKIHSILSIKPAVLPAIDWEAQWANHGWDFYDGKIHLNLNQFSSKEGLLVLKPGPGFGDLSHVTTRLVLKCMGSYIHNQIVVDIGCGSGILTLAALKMGASAAYGIDIDPQALEHSLINAQLNQLEKDCYFYLPIDFSLPNFSQKPLIVMNMILTEQKEAWQALPILHSISSQLITSGIREEERDVYLDLTKKWNWQFIEETNEEGWLSFMFEKNK